MRVSTALAAVFMAAWLAACGQNAQEAPAPDSTAPAADLTAQANTTFETWTEIGTPTVGNAAAAAPDGSTTADTLTLDRGDGVGLTTSDAGANVTARVMLWGTEGQNVALQLVNWCRSDASQVETSNIVLTAQPAEYEVSHAFPAEDCVRFQIIMTDNGGVVNAWNPRVERSGG